jgi:excisionase family DNA binding protein
MEESVKSLLAARDGASGTSRPATVYSVGEFARALGVGEMTVYRAIHAGRLPAIKFGGRYVVPAKALDELIEAAMSTGALVDIADGQSVQGGVA